MPDLFDTPPVPGLTFAEDSLGRADEAALIARIDAEPLVPFRFQGWLGKRLTHSYGWHYDFDGATLARADPLPAWLLPVREMAAGLAGLPPEAFVQALLIRYDPGAGVGWHRDRPVFAHVVGISLGNPATLRLRRRRTCGFDRAAVPLPPRSLYHLAGAARSEWEHSIAPMAVPRWSITFRSLSERGRAAGQR